MRFMPDQLRISPRDARAIFDYNRAVFDRFVRRVRKLRLKEAMRQRGIGHESLFNTLVHILNVHEVWLVYIVHGRNSDKVLEPLFDDVRRHPTTWSGFDQVLGSCLGGGRPHATRPESAHAGPTGESVLDVGSLHRAGRPDPERRWRRRTTSERSSGHSGRTMRNPPR